MACSKRSSCSSRQARGRVVPELTGCRIAAIEVESSMKGRFRWDSAQPFLLGMLP